MVRQACFHAGSFFVFKQFVPTYQESSHGNYI